MFEHVIENFLEYRGCTNIKINYVNGGVEINYRLPTNITVKELALLSQSIKEHLEAIVEIYKTQAEIVEEILRE